MKYTEKSTFVKLFEKAVIFFSLFTIVIVGYFFSNIHKYSRINRLDIQTVIKANGDIEVVENLKYKFRGECDGIYRGFDLGKDELIITDVEVTDKKGNKVKYNNSATPSEGDYYLSDSGDMKIFSKSKNETKNVTIKYTVKQAVEKYSKDAVFCWRFYKLSEYKDIKRGSITVSLDKASNNNFKILNYEFFGGKSTNISNEDGTVKIDLKDMDSNLVALVEFDKDFIDASIPEKNNTFNIYEKGLIDDDSEYKGIVLDAGMVFGIIFLMVVAKNGYNIYLVLTGRVGEVKIRRSRRRNNFGGRGF